MKLKWTKLSETYKILLSMLLFVMVIQLLTLLYVWQVESKVLLKKERENLRYQLDIDANILMQKMKSFEQELKFLTTLNVMDDVLVHDVDKRILVLLEKKSSDLGEGIVLQAFKDIVLVASSQQIRDINDYLSFNITIFSSFDRDKKIGILKLLYPIYTLDKKREK